MKIDTNDPRRNGIKEHERYDELQNIISLITNNIIVNFINKNIVPV